jgi:hypothetical protein
MADNDASVVPIIPAPPRPPRAGWTESYGNELNRWLENTIRTLTGFQYARLWGMYLAPGVFPTSGDGLKPGEVFSNDGILTLVREGDIWAGGFEVSAELGTLTVTV